MLGEHCAVAAGRDVEIEAERAPHLGALLARDGEELRIVIRRQIACGDSSMTSSKGSQ